MRYDLICIVFGILMYAAGAHLGGGILVGAGLVIALRSK